MLYTYRTVDPILNMMWVPYLKLWKHTNWARDKSPNQNLFLSLSSFQQRIHHYRIIPNDEGILSIQVTGLKPQLFRVF